MGAEWRIWKLIYIEKKFKKKFPRAYEAFSEILSKVFRAMDGEKLKKLRKEWKF